MRPIKSIAPSLCRSLRGIFCDLDDTLTLDGKLREDSFRALWRALRAGMRLVVVTGRPAGWADHIARMWPVDAVVGENGSFYFWMEGGRMRRFFVQDERERKACREKLDEVRRRVLAQVPRAAVSADQIYRESDLAIDFCEDIEALTPEERGRIMAIFRESGAQVKISSIHINGWFGDFDKLTTCRLLVGRLFGEPESQSFPDYIYCGDSPNDEPMFSAFAHSVGVANIVPWLPAMKFHPVYQTSLAGGEGFAEMVECILQNRQADHS